MDTTLYWFDYETFGTDPARDRIAQVGGLRTTLELEAVGEPLLAYCRPPPDYLPHPEACLITGITPQQALERGVCEAEFAWQLLDELAVPATCSVGYNNMRFDEEFTRYLLYRNLHDPYAREWRNGNSRWDLIDVMRLAHALRPQGIEWPQRDDGATSFRLQDLTAANGLAHEHAHDALSDVHATLELARLLRARQRRLFDFVFSHRQKRQLTGLLRLDALVPVLHVSARYPAELGCIAMVLPLAAHPINSNGVVVFDLRQDPAALLELDADEIRQRLFAPRAQEAGVERPALKTLHLNRAPVVVPVNTLTGTAGERWGIDPARAERHRDLLAAHIEPVRDKLREVFSDHQPQPDSDPEHALYSGGFIDDHDRRLLDRIELGTPARDLRSLAAQLSEPRLVELLFRYRARNFPDSLDHDEQLRWHQLRRRRLSSGDNGLYTLDELDRTLDGLEGQSRSDQELGVLTELRRYAEQLRTGS